MHLLVTGGAGFIGSNYVRMALSGNLEDVETLTVLDSLTYAGVKQNLDSVQENKKFRFIQGDILDSELVLRSIKNVDAVINFAAESHVDRSILNSKSFIETNVVGVQTLLDAIKVSPNKIRFIQISTDEVYGSIANGSWDETSGLFPNSIYSASKAGGELLARAYFQTHGLDVLVTRCSNNYGPHHFPEKLIPLFITNIIEGKKIPIYGTGKNIRDWLHVDDHCRAIHQVLLNGKSGEVYNIGGGEELTNLEITKMILEEMEADESSIEYVPDRKGHDFRYSLNWDKIRNELGYAPQINFREGLHETISWYRNNVRWWEPLKKRSLDFGNI